MASGICCYIIVKVIDIAFNPLIPKLHFVNVRQYAYSFRWTRSHVRWRFFFTFMTYSAPIQTGSTNCGEIDLFLYWVALKITNPLFSEPFSNHEFQYKLQNFGKLRSNIIFYLSFIGIA